MGSLFWDNEEGANNCDLNQVEHLFWETEIHIDATSLSTNLQKVSIAVLLAEAVKILLDLNVGD